MLDHQDDDSQDEMPDYDSDGTLDPVNVDLGIMNCNVQHDDGDREYYFELETGNQVVADFCQATHDTRIDLGSATSVQAGGIIVLVTEDDDADGCPVADVTANALVDVCTERLSIPLNNCKSQGMLSPDKLVLQNLFANRLFSGDTANRDRDLWKQGDTFYRDCITWSFAL